MLQNLNDDCLLEIFQKLNLQEQLTLTQVDERFRTLIVERIWRIKFHKIKTSHYGKLPLIEFKMFFLLMAPYITELILDGDGDHCWFGRLTLNFYFSLEYPELRALCCQSIDFRYDYLIVVARTSPKLEILEFKCWETTGEYICDMPNLQRLSLISYRLDPDYFQKMFNNQKILHVRLQGGIINEQGWNNVLTTIFPKITKLRFRDYWDNEGLFSPHIFNSSAHLFENLELLYVAHCYRLIDFVCTLHTLKELHLPYSGIQMDDLLRVVANNVHLEQLYIEYMLTPEGICKLSDLRRQQQQRQQCKVLLTIYVNTVDLYVYQMRHIIKDHDSKHAYEEPVVKIEEHYFGFLNGIDEHVFDFTLEWK